MRLLQVTVTAFVMALGLPLSAHAQSGGASNTPTQQRISWEFGQDVYTGSGPGELGMYGGVSQGNNLMAFRAGIMDEADTVPCSIGVMYQYISHGDTPARIKPTAGLSLGRVYSCASDKDPRKGSPRVHGTATLSAGVRMAMFSGRHVAGSLDAMVFRERLSGSGSTRNRDTKGVMLGVAIHSAR